MLKGKQKNLDLNHNGKLDSQDFKMLRGEEMAKGGSIKVHIDTDRGTVSQTFKGKNEKDAQRKVDAYLNGPGKMWGKNITIIPFEVEEMKRGGKAKAPKRSAHSIELDSEIKAKKPGKRVSASGNVYYESRPNHADENRKKKPYLEMGGKMEMGGEATESKWVYKIGGLNL